MKTNNTHIISILVKDEPGVLLKLASLFVRRCFNINTIAVGSTEKKGISRVIITLKGDEKIIYQLEKQLSKLIVVFGVSDLTNNAIVKELCLLKIKMKNEKLKKNILDYIDLCNARVIDMNMETMIIEITETPDKIQDFINGLSNCKIEKITRTGIIAMKKI